jgi:hypothetical protein
MKSGLEVYGWIFGAIRLNFVADLLTFVEPVSNIDGTVVEAGKIESPLAVEPPRLVGADWQNGTLTLKLDRTVTADWVDAIQNHLGSYEAAPRLRGSADLISRARTHKSSLLSAAWSTSALPLIAAKQRTFREVRFVPIVLQKPAGWVRSAMFVLQRTAF